MKSILETLEKKNIDLKTSGYKRIVISNSEFELLKKAERQRMIDFAFSFYYDFSKQNKVDENLISENKLHAEVYYDEKFNKENDNESAQNND